MSQTNKVEAGRPQTGDGDHTVYLEESFERDIEYITDRIVADPSTATPKDGGQLWPVEADRYRLVVARACPWANRALIVRRLLGLEGAISLAVAGPIHDWRSWTFDRDPGEVDPVLGIPRLRDAYLARFPEYPKGITVPAIVEVDSGKVVTNDFWSMTQDMANEWTSLHRDGAPDLYPLHLQDQIDEMSMSFYEDVNNGVYKSGFAGSQSSHERAFHTLFGRLDALEEHLTTRRYLVGDSITLADVRLWPTLARFDAVYHGHFKTNRNKLAEMPALWAYARDLYRTPGFGDQIDWVETKQHYYGTHLDINPTGIVPAGPAVDGWLTPHGREALGGSPFGDGTAPGPVPVSERPPVEHNTTLAAGLVREP